ncbi:putative deoxyribonuclease TATDN2 [Discoglossus pictus]
MAAGDGGTRKHKWSSPTELSPHKYMKSSKTKLSRRLIESREYESESCSLTRDRHVNPETSSQGSQDPEVGELLSSSVRGRTFYRGRLRRSWPTFKQTAPLEYSAAVVSDHSVVLQSEVDDELKPAEDPRMSQDDRRSSARRAQAPSMLFMKAFRDIIGKPNRTSAKPPDTKCGEEPDSPEEPTTVTISTKTPERDCNDLTEAKESEENLKESPEPERTVTDWQPEPETNGQEENRRLIFVYEDDSDKDVGAEINSEKDPSIGSDFSDLEDVGQLARFSQEELVASCCPGEDDSSGTSSGYVMYPPYPYRSSWNNYTEPWAPSPTNTYQNSLNRKESNSSHLSEPSANVVENSAFRMSSDSDTIGERRRERSGSLNSLWMDENATKLMRRSSDTRSPADVPRTPKFLQDGFIDTHCHLDMLFSKLSFNGTFAQLRRDYATTFPREFQGCIADFCDPGTLHDQQWEHLLGEDMVWGAFGCHPHFAQYYTNAKQEAIMKALRHPKAIAYGEMGLDYSPKCSTKIPMQHMVFEKQLKLAVSVGKPLVIHCRDADDDLFKIMKKLVPWDYKIHRHCFTGQYSQIEPFLTEFPNMFVGFTALLTYPSAQEAREAMRQIPLERLIVETDAPYFVPKQVPRSLCKFSHPGLALHTVQEMAKQKNLPLGSVLSTLRQNTTKLYNV